MRRLCFAALALGPWIAGCDRIQPAEPPPIQAASTGAGGPTVGAPSNTAIAVSESRVDVAWQDNSTNETGFEVWRSLSGPNGTFTKLAGTGPNVTKYVDGGLNPVSQYCYQVRAFRAYDGKTRYSSISNTACATTPASPPAAPTGLTATGLDGPAIDLAWTDNSAVEDGYEVRRSADGVTFSAVATVPANSTNYRDGGVSENKTYWYVVRAMKDGAFSAPSSVASARAGVLTPPAAPWLQAEARTANWLQFGGSGNADGFEIERCEGITCGDAEFGRFPTTGPPYWSDFYSDYVSSFYDTAVALGTTYTYRVRAFNRAGYSAWSNLAEVTAMDGY